jgi:8-oxo-dGTP pyrophosphatase MutT (NUDIX family)
VELDKRWNQLRRMIPEVVTQRAGAVNSVQHAAMTGQDPIVAFQAWIDEAMRQVILGINGSWTLRHVRAAGDAGVQRASWLVGLRVTDAFDPNQPRDDHGRWTGGDDELSDDERAAVTDYVIGDSPHLSVNKKLREGKNLSAKESEYADKISSAIAKSYLNEDAVVYRGGAKFPEGHFTDAGFMSTSKDLSQASSFGKDVIEIRLPLGSRALEIEHSIDSSDEETRGAVQDEREIILDRNTRLLYLGRDKKSGRKRYEIQQQTIDAAPSTLLAIDRIPHLQSLVVTELQGIMEAVSQQAVRSFANGLLTKQTTSATARAIAQVIDSTGKHRSALLASFAVVRAFSLTTLDHFRAAGLTHVGTVAERARGTAPALARDAAIDLVPSDLVGVLTAEDDAVCPQCEEISADGPYRLDEAERLIPAHPNCRCAFVPWDEDLVEDAKWDEEDHPRDEDGKFTVKVGGKMRQMTEKDLKKEGFKPFSDIGYLNKKGVYAWKQEAKKAEPKSQFSTKEEDALTTWGDAEANIEGSGTRAFEALRRSDSFGETIDKLPKYSGTVYRGFQVKSPSFRPGQSITMDKHSAGAKTLSHAKTYTNPPEGQRATGEPVIFKISGGSVPDFGKSNFSSEHGEVIVPKGTKMRVRSVEKKGKVTIVSLDVQRSRTARDSATHTAGGGTTDEESASLWIEEHDACGDHVEDAFNPDQPRDDDGKWTTVYHGTGSQHVESILATGINKSRSQEHLGVKPGVFVSPTKAGAAHFAEQNVGINERTGKRTKPVVLELRVPKELVENAEIDREAKRVGKRGLVLGRKIPKSWIKKVHDAHTHTAAGIMFLDPNGRALFVRRSSTGDHAGEWGFPGGAIEPGETAEGAAMREALEETGRLAVDLEEVDRRELDGVDFTTYATSVGEAFEPELNDEHDDWTWASLDDHPEPLHPGVWLTVDDAVHGIVTDEEVSDFDENQPRDQNGRWTAQNHPAGPYKSQKRGTSAERVRGRRELERLQNMLPDDERAAKIRELKLKAIASFWKQHAQLEAKIARYAEKYNIPNPLRPGAPVASTTAPTSLSSLEQKKEKIKLDLDRLAYMPRGTGATYAAQKLVDQLAERDLTGEDFVKGMLPVGAVGKPEIQMMHSGGVSVRASLDGGGSIERQINLDTKSVYHAYFRAGRNTGSGLGKEILRSQVALYEKLGIQQVKVSANIDVGGYAWAKYGFVQTRDEWTGITRRVLTSRLASFERNPTYRDRDGVQQTMTPQDISGLRKLIASDDPRALWAVADSRHGKRMLLDTNWHGTLDLRNDETMRRFRAYVAPRPAFGRRPET